MKKVLVTGITGFVGSHMADYLLLKKDSIVYGLKRMNSNLENIKNILNKIILFDGDLNLCTKSPAVVSLHHHSTRIVLKNKTPTILLVRLFIFFLLLFI